MVAARKGEPYDPEAACVRHKNYGECSADPECGWCSADEQCYGRTIGANCTTNLQTTRCPGVCPALADCHSCLIHGHPLPQYMQIVSAAHKLGKFFICLNSWKHSYLKFQENIFDISFIIFFVFLDTFHIYFSTFVWNNFNNVFIFD